MKFFVILLSTLFLIGCASDTNSDQITTDNQNPESRIQSHNNQIAQENVTIDELLDITKQVISQDILAVGDIPSGIISNESFSSALFPEYNKRSVTYNSQSNFVNVVYYDEENLSNSLIHIIRMDTDLKEAKIDGSGSTKTFDADFIHHGSIKLSTDLSNQQVNANLEIDELFIDDMSDNIAVIRYIQTKSNGGENVLFFKIPLSLDIKNQKNIQVSGKPGSPITNIETTYDKIYVNIFDKNSEILQNL